jgi:hypothetical protein
LVVVALPWADYQEAIKLLYLLGKDACLGQIQALVFHWVMIALLKLGFM